MERGKVAEQQAVGFGAFDEFQIARLAGFQDARGGEDDFAGGAAGCFDGFLVAAGVFEIAVDLRDSCFEGGFELGEGAGENGEGRSEGEGESGRGGWY